MQDDMLNYCHDEGPYSQISRSQSPGNIAV